MEGFPDRLLALKGKMSEAAFARKCEIGGSTLRQYLTGGTPGMDKVILIAKANGVSITWLATGEGPRDLPAVARHVLDTEQEHGRSGMLQVVDPAALKNGAFVLLPRYEVGASAGHGIIAPSEELRDFVAYEASYLRSMGINPSNAHLVQVQGRSMMPALVDGEWMIVDTSATAIVDDAIYALVDGEEVLVKRLRRDGADVLLISDNKAEGYGDRRVAVSDLGGFRIVGRVRRHIRSL